MFLLDQEGKKVKKYKNSTKAQEMFQVMSLPEGRKRIKSKHSSEMQKNK